MSENGFKPFEVAQYLDSEELIAEYLSVAMEDPDPAHFLQAFSEVAKARGMTQLAKDAGLSRESLYKTLSVGSHPRFETVLKLMHALGVTFKAIPQKPVQAHTPR
jgi:probable addiction module antidote protein